MLHNVINIAENAINISDSTKFLLCYAEFIIDEYLTWTHHINYFTNKLNYVRSD